VAPAAGRRTHTHTHTHTYFHLYIVDNTTIIILQDVHEVSNAEFDLFVRETGHKTEAETFGDSFVMDAFISEKVLFNNVYFFCW
jgi:hypothetical protein